MCIHPYYNQDPIKKVSILDINLEDIDLEFMFTAIYTLVDDIYPRVIPLMVQKRRGPSPALKVPTTEELTPSTCNME